MNAKERIASYLAQGLKPSQVSSICGVTPAYISQLVKEAKENQDSEFALLLRTYTEKESESFSEDKALTSKYTSMEHKLLEQMESQMAYAELPALTNALRVVAERQEKRLSRMQAPAATTQIMNVVQLTLPAHATPEYQISSQREVISIGAQQLAPLSSDGVKGLFAQIQAQKQAAQQQELKTIEATDF